MTVIVQQPTDSNGNPQPMAYDSDTKKIIVDSNGFIVSGGQRLVNVPSKADYVSTPKTQSSGFLEAWNYTQNQINTGGSASAILIEGSPIISAPITLSSPVSTDTAPKVITSATGSAGIELNIPSSSGYAITIDTSNYGGTNFYFSGFVVTAQQASGGFLYADNGDISNLNNIRLEDINFGAGSFTTYPVYLNNFSWVRFLHLQFYLDEENYVSSGYIGNSNIFEFWDTNPENGFTVDNVQETYIRGNAILSNSFVRLASTIKYVRIEGTYLQTIALADGTAVETMEIIGGIQVPYNNLISMESGGSATINNLRISGCVWQPQDDVTLIGSGVTVNNFDITPKNLTTGSVTYGTNTMTFMPSPTLSANPPVSATVYQNTNPYAIEIDLPVYATTAGTAGYVTVAKGATSTPSAIGNQYVSGDTSDTSEQIIRLRVPAGWYYEFTASGVTFGTASVFAD